MRISLVIDREWTSSDFAFHLLDLTTLYRVELLDGLPLGHIRDIVAESPQAFERYLYGGNLLGLHPDLPALKLVRLSLSSPLQETLEGATRAIGGLADLIEKIAFFRITKRKKELEIESAMIDIEAARLELANKKIENLQKTLQLMREHGVQEVVLSEFIRRYLRTVENIGILIENGSLISVSRETNVQEIEARVEVSEEQGQDESYLDEFQ